MISPRYLIPIKEANTQVIPKHSSTTNITISMDGKGRATDNICIERFWRSAKVEKIYLNEYNSVSILKDDVKWYIEFYNHRRFHETLEYQKPMNVYHEGLKLNDRTDSDSDKRVG
jgi:putative transposase